jgi:hypothetical protein
MSVTYVDKTVTDFAQKQKKNFEMSEQSETCMLSFLRRLGRTCIIIFGQVKHVDQLDIKIVGKVHVTVDLHTKVLHFDRRKIQLFLGMSVHMVVPHHGRQFAAGPGGSLGFLGIDGDDADLILVFVTVWIVFTTVVVPATDVVVQAAVVLRLLNDSKEESFGIFGVLKRVVQGPAAQTISIGRDQQMNGRLQCGLFVQGGVVLRVMIIRTLVR